MGNHDTWPVNVQDFRHPYDNNVVKSYVNAWSDWLGEEAAETFKKYGYYSLDFNQFDGSAAAPAGSKIIALNTQAENPANFWIWGDREDPGEVINWLETELAAIEKAGGLAYIIGHVQPFNY